MKRAAFIIILLCTMLLGTSKLFAQVSVQVSIAPPEIPVYVQPACPYDGWIWTPGYWAYDPADGYYWVPGSWNAPPTVGFLWTPGYWGFEGGYYHWYHGYWGPHVGFYGGINYGCGYGGSGYYGGRWEGGHFHYNTAVTRVNTRIVHNTYVDRTVIHNGGSRAGFNGPHGASARPSAGEMAAAKERHVQPTSRQVSHQAAASKNPNRRFSVNKGNPANHAAGRPAATQHGASPAARSNANHGAASRPQQHQASRPQSAPGMQTYTAPRAQSQHNTPAQHAAPRMQPQHAAPAQHSQPRMQPQHAAPQQHAATRMQPQHAAPQPRPQMQAPREAPHGGGGEGRRR